MVHVQRQVRSLVREGDAPEMAQAFPLSEFRAHPAWVLLGEPGSGKTESFRKESEVTGGRCLTIGEFLLLDDLSSLNGVTLYLDGLDEVRASGAGESVLTQIRLRLQKLGNPPFRLSCRAADWRGESDRAEIAGALPDGRFATLQLEPLSADDVLVILKENHGLPDPEKFVESARAHRIAELLDNPKTLELLAKSFGAGRFPETRQDTYERACEQLAREDSKARRDKTRHSAPSVERILDAAGHLCAVALLADEAGIALDSEASGPGYPVLDRFRPADLQVARWALGRKLFRASSAEERMMPNHRSIAEYLAARWLAGRIGHDGLPLGRVLNLLVGLDGLPVAGLRGLYAWLALLSTEARPRLIDADPLTVVVYGDIKPMPAEDKRRILGGLRRAAESPAAFRWEARGTAAFGALVDRDLLDDFQTGLADADRSNGAQSYADCLLDALRYGEPLPELSPILKRIVEDDSRWGVIRKDALHAWLRNAATEDAVALLDAIETGRVRDSDDELAGLLLGWLYPGRMPAGRLWTYLHVPKAKNLIGTYTRFWEHQVPTRAPSSDLPILLDTMASDPQKAAKTLVGFNLRRFCGRLLARAVEEYGDRVGDERLFDWLTFGGDENHTTREESERAKIAAWIGARPDRYKGLLGVAFRRCDGVEHARSCIYAKERRLHGATPPGDLGLWHLDQVDRTGDEILAQEHLARAVFALMRETGHQGLSLERFEDWAERHPDRRDWLNPLLAWDWSPDDWHAEEARRNKGRELTRAARKQTTTNEVRKHLERIRTGTALPALMHRLAGVWDGRYTDTPGDNPAERFAAYCDNGTEAMTAAAEGFVACCARDDLPQVSEIVALSIKNEEHFIRLPCLIGMDLRRRLGARYVEELRDDTLRRMVAFRLTYGVGETPAWFLDLVGRRPDLVAEVLVDYASAVFRSKLQHVDGIYPLAHDPVYEPVARLAVPVLLKRFPPRVPTTRLHTLETLLRSARRYRLPELPGLIAKKAMDERMDVRQKVYWLASGLLQSPADYESALWSYVGKSEIRAGALSAFLSDDATGDGGGASMSAETLAKLVALLAPRAQLEWPRGGGTVTEAMHRGDHVRALIRRLGGMGSPEALAALDRLLSDPALEKARFALEDARQQAKARRREDSFRFLPLDDVVSVLANASPASAADLAALVVNCIDDIAREIRTDNDNGVHAFWNVETRNSRLTPTGPRPENLCTQELSRRLSNKLGRYGVESVLEFKHVNEKRSDLRLSFANRFALPLEAKRDTNAELWVGLRRQLVDRYAIEPKAYGYGVYVVYWFGDKGLPSANDGGKRPTTSAELRSRLEAQLDADERRRIFVRVIDVSWPGNAA